MNDFVTCVGWFVIAMLALALASGCICCVLWAYDKAMERFEWSVDAKTRMELGRAIGAGAWWFSEHPQTRRALTILSERIVNGYGVDAYQWRDEWLKQSQETQESQP